MVPVFFTLIAGLGVRIPVSPDGFLLHLLLNAWLFILAVVTGLVALALARQAGNFSERYKRIVNAVLLVAAIGLAPMVLAVIGLMLLGPFSLIGKVPR
jgi:hypothetical protein